ncbi:octaprenyl-diphosphate synthase [Albimonas donghaensis]|uniref:Octaprenyl diphosphate synthase n=2 Tax=Albimonas donghaensis TaxID=356660 RepID=A0A1H2WAZ5_9RHOB|nr:octaprenyl-diphosphate synthase [Albimonas donghaensis]
MTAPAAPARSQAGPAPQDAFSRLQALVAEDMGRVNHLIATRMASEHAPRIPEITRHLVEAGGKRLRPILTLAAARLCGYEGEHHVLLAATVEFIHTATLLHDDVVDESAQRRGRPTANLLWDNKSSVLVGDFLFSRSFQLMVEADSLRVLAILADASAVIAEGEVMQLATANDLSTGEDAYLRMIHGKTAALFAAASEVGGVIAEAEESRIEALRAYGQALGMAFQIVDDLLDYGGSSAALGKNVGDDFREGKVTLPVLLAAAAAPDDAARDFWVRVIERREQGEDDLPHALELMRASGALAETEARARAYAEEARAALAPFPASPLREALADVVDFVVSRLN